jgi:hypothetical protein
MTKKKPTLSAKPKAPAVPVVVDDAAAAAFIGGEVQPATMAKVRMGRPPKAQAKARTWDQVTLYLPPETLRALRHRAVDDGTDLSDLVAAAVDAWLKAPSNT